ncbi:hypothetical protein ACFQUU_14620 [Herbaspirillum sp. GCM10030257]|uniref:hypothetical protein n=1 Tax=Herbaspirillum sp. GCM10030257 TaxID=3273393 RepID=UPI003615C8C3
MTLVAKATTQAIQPKMPRTIWVGGFVSLLMNVSSKLICSDLPAFMTMVPGTSAMAVGIIKSGAEEIASRLPLRITGIVPYITAALLYLEMVGRHRQRAKI